MKRCTVKGREDDGSDIMRILYVTSGVNYLYPHRLIDDSIIHSLPELPCEVKAFQIHQGISWVDDLLGIITEYEPDYVFTIHGTNLSPEIVQLIQGYGALMGIWFIDDPYDLDESLGKLYGYDLVFTNELNCVPIYTKRGYQAHYLPLGTVSEFYYTEIPPREYRSDVCFIGSPFPRRIEIIRYLLSKLPRGTLKIVGPYWREYLPNCKEVMHKYVTYDEMRKYYNGAKINLNLHRQSDEHIIPGYQVNSAGISASSPNNRTYDIGACRGFQLSDYRLGLEEIFDLQTELITFNSQENLLKLIHYYLDKSYERRWLAENMFRKVSRQHLLKKRLLDMVQKVKEVIKPEVLELVTLQMLQQGILVKGTAPAVYLVYQNRRHLIPSLKIFDQLKLCWEDVRYMADEEIRKISKGVPIEF